MNIALLLRYMDQKQGGHWDHIYHMQHDYRLMADKYGVGLAAIITPYAMGSNPVMARLITASR